MASNGWICFYEFDRQENQITEIDRIRQLHLLLIDLIDFRYFYRLLGDELHIFRLCRA